MPALLALSSGHSLIIAHEVVKEFSAINGVTMEAVLGPRRPNATAQARHQCAWALVKRFGFSLNLAAIALHRTNHATIIHSRRLIDEARKDFPFVKHLTDLAIARIRKALDAQGVPVTTPSLGINDPIARQLTLVTDPDRLRHLRDFITALLPS